MIGMVRHIEYLLLHNDQVAVPGLGCFSVYYHEARILDDHASYLPPMRTITFDSGAESECDLLAHSIMRARFITRAEAEAVIADEVAALRQELQQTHAYSFGRLGHLIEEEGTITFEAGDENRIAYPRLGFAPIEAPVRQEVIEEEVAQEETKRDRVYISFPRRALRIASVAAAVIVFLLMLSRPIPVNDTTVNYAGVLSAELFAQSTEDTLATEVLVDDMDNATSSAQMAATATELQYYVIVASLPNRSLAEKQIQCFSQQGNTADLRIYETDSKARLYIASFATMAEAQQYRVQLIKEQPLFENAWIMNAKG